MRSPRASASQPRRPLPWRDILDVLALTIWSAMLFRYWFGGKLLLLLHPDYAWLSNTAAIVLLALAGLRLARIWPDIARGGRRAPGSQSSGGGEHVTLLPPSLSSAVLLGVAVFGLIYTPQAFASQTALQRGIADTLSLTRSQPQRFVRAAAPEERTIIDWIRLVNVYPEPDEYTGDPVNVTGFVLYPQGWPEGYMMVSRFVLTCCAADAYPVGLPVKISEQSGGPRAFPQDSWVAITGEIYTETLDNRRQIAVAPTEVRATEEPDNPYEY